VLGDSGALVPVNTAALLPSPSENTSALMNATFMQFLHPKFGLVAGKIFTFDSAEGEFAGTFRTQFLNTGLVAPMTAALVPISAYGGGVIVLPWEGLTLSALALDPSGTPTNNDVTEAFDDGVMVLANGKLDIKPFGLVGHQSVGMMWSNKERLELKQDPSNTARILLRERFPRLSDPGPVLTRILERFFPNLLTPVQPLKRQRDTWLITYGFEQYLWQPGGDPHRGIGVFFNFGATDGKVNPLRYSYNLGIGGNGVVPGRPNDTFGVGWARTEFTDNFLPFLRRALELGLDREDAVEMYYNAALTPWLGVTLDLQVIEPAIKKKLESNQLKNVDTTLIIGSRLYIRF
jgi:porin